MVQVYRNKVERIILIQYHSKRITGECRVRVRMPGTSWKIIVGKLRLFSTPECVFYCSETYLRIAAVGSWYSFWNEIGRCKFIHYLIDRPYSYKMHQKLVGNIRKQKYFHTEISKIPERFYFLLLKSFHIHIILTHPYLPKSSQFLVSKVLRSTYIVIIKWNSQICQVISTM